MMTAFMSTLIKMSLRGIVIVFVVLLVRLLLKRLRVGHKYILGLWAMTFLYFIIPWKLSLPMGFWNNVAMPEEVRVVTEPQIISNENQEAADSDLDSVADTSAVLTSGAADYIEPIATTPAEAPKQNITGGGGRENTVEKSSRKKPELGSVLGILWLVGLSALFGHMLYTYFALKRKLRVSMLYRDNIWWAEDIDMPMVFGLLLPRIYLPVSMKSEDLSYVIAHEKMHIKRKDAPFKMLIYGVCLIHWFNPFIWIAYMLFGNDIEKACDEEVIQSMSKEKRKEYAYALLHIAAGNGTRKKRIFVAPICFDEGNVKSRIGNIMKYKYTIPAMGAVAVLVILALSTMFLTEAKGESLVEDREREEAGTEGTDQNGEGTVDANRKADGEVNEETEELPTFYIEDLSALQIGENFSLEDYYITNCYTYSNHYYIDENGVLWGTGTNEFGQLGTGTYGIEESYEEPVKIAENVVSVDASWNGYFCIYLTEDGWLYGIGSNHAEVLLGEESESGVYSDYDYKKVTEPVLMMTDVAYAKAGRECVVALQTTKTAYWWGQYAPWTHTDAGGLDAIEENYWKLEEDGSNPLKMFAEGPMKIMEQCKFVTTGTFTGAAISESGELYTWGFNVFGQCGTPVTEDDFVRTPTKVMDGVKMVWPERMAFSDPVSQSPYADYNILETSYEYNTFVLKEDNSLLAVGLDMGDKEKVTHINGDLVETKTNLYSDEFVPIEVVEYSVSNNLATLNKLQFGMSVQEVEGILNSANMYPFQVDESMYNEGYAVGLSAQYSQYHCYFDFGSPNKLVKITIQEGGSRDGRFVLGMSLADLKEAVANAGGTLTEIEKDAPWAIWVYQDHEQHIQYEFSVYEERVTVVSERVIVDPE